jgi:hypothetical protein
MATLFVRSIGQGALAVDFALYLRAFDWSAGGDQCPAECGANEWRCPDTLRRTTQRPWRSEAISLCLRGGSGCVAELVEIGVGASPAERGYRVRQQGQCIEGLAPVPTFAIRRLCAW